ncbi:MAG: hypothetical protein WCW02_04690 [Candidatus Buchananbacteria bacterium]
MWKAIKYVDEYLIIASFILLIIMGKFVFPVPWADFSMTVLALYFLVFFPLLIFGYAKMVMSGGTLVFGKDDQIIEEFKNRWFRTYFNPPKGVYFFYGQSRYWATISGSLPSGESITAKVDCSWGGSREKAIELFRTYHQDASGAGYTIISKRINEVLANYLSASPAILVQQLNQSMESIDELPNFKMVEPIYLVIKAKKIVEKQK